MPTAVATGDQSHGSISSHNVFQCPFLLLKADALPRLFFIFIKRSKRGFRVLRVMGVMRLIRVMRVMHRLGQGLGLETDSDRDQNRERNWDWDRKLDRHLD